MNLQDDIRLSSVQPDGSTLQDHYRVFAEAEGIDPDEYIDSHRQAPEFPQRLLWLWETFHDLSAARQVSASGPNPILYQEILAWGHLFGHQFSIWEVDALRALDSAWLIAVADNRKDRKKNDNRRKTSSRR